MNMKYLGHKMTSFMLFGNDIFELNISDCKGTTVGCS